MEALQIVVPGEVNIVSYYALGSAHHRPVRRFGKAVNLVRPETTHRDHTKRALHLKWFKNLEVHDSTKTLLAGLWISPVLQFPGNFEGRKPVFPICSYGSNTPYFSGGLLSKPRRSPIFLQLQGPCQTRVFCLFVRTLYPIFPYSFWRHLQ